LHQVAEDPGKNIELVKLYLDHIDDAVQDNQGNTPLHALCINTWDNARKRFDPERLNKAVSLINAPRGKSILVPNKQGITPLELEYIAILDQQRKNYPRECYIIYEIFKNKMEARLHEASYAQETGYGGLEFQGQHSACKERIEQLEEKQKEEAQRGNKGYIGPAIRNILFYIGCGSKKPSKKDE